MSQASAMGLLLIEIRRRIHEVDWIETPYFQMMMTETGDEWINYYHELRAIPHKLTIGELEPPEIINGKLIFRGWPPTPSDYGSSWDRMASFSKRKNE
jgi:hypothetical protein